MDITLSSGKLCIGLYELMDLMSADDKRKLADTLSCEDSIIEDVASQILDGWTEAGSHGAKGGGEPDPHYPLGKARREVALRAGDVARQEIEDLRRSLIWSKEREEEYRDAYFRLYHAWDHSQGRCPDGPPNAHNRERPAYVVVLASEYEELKKKGE